MAVQAHRGSPEPAAGIVENTLAAFERARRLGADGIELDVRRTADGALVVHHDPVVAGLGPIGELAATRLPSGVPLLGEVLDACSGMTVNIEIKNLPGEPGYDPGERVAAGVAGLVASAGLVSAVVVSSFWPESLAAVRRARPEIATGLLVAEWFEPADCVAAALHWSCSAVHPHASLVSADLVDEAHRAGLAVAAWTVNERREIAALAALGVDTVITDDVPLARSALADD